VRQEKKWKETREWRGGGREREREREEERRGLFPLLVINQYSSRMLPACAIIINYTQERSWSRKRTAERGEREGRCNKGILFTLKSECRAREEKY